jgi:hypothetical protein
MTRQSVNKWLRGGGVRIEGNEIVIDALQDAAQTG